MPTTPYACPTGRRVEKRYKTVETRQEFHGLEIYSLKMRRIVFHNETRKAAL